MKPRFLYPALHVASVGAITPALIREAAPNAKAVGFDVHQTLTDQAATHVPDAHVAVVRALAQDGFLVGLISTARHPARAARVHAFAQQLSVQAGLQYELPVVTSEVVSGQDKPHRAPFRRLAQQMGGVPLRQMCYVGNQVHRDVLGANRAGCTSILVDPYGRAPQLKIRYMQRPAEMIVRGLLGIPWRVSE